MAHKPVLSIKEQLAAQGATLGDLSFVGLPTARNKWGNERVETEDGTFDSRLEQSTWVDLKRRQAAGEIEGLQRQVGYAIFVGDVLICEYRADFVFYEDGKLVVADAKGRATSEYILKYKLMRAVFGITIREYTSVGVAPERKVRVRA